MVPHLSVVGACQRGGHGLAIVPILAPLCQRVLAQREKEGKTSLLSRQHR